MTTQVGNSELHLESDLLWTPWWGGEGGRTLSPGPRAWRRLLTLGLFWVYSQALGCVAGASAVLGDSRGILGCSDLPRVWMMAGLSS